MCLQLYLGIKPSLTHSLCVAGFSGEGTLSAFDVRKHKLLMQSELLDSGLLSLALVKVKNISWTVSNHVKLYILHDISVTFLYISPKPPLPSRTWLIIRKPMSHWFQRYIAIRKYSQLFTNKSNTFLSIPPIQTDGTECVQTHKSENIISASFNPFTWQI